MIVKSENFEKGHIYEYLGNGPGFNNSCPVFKNEVDPEGQVNFGGWVEPKNMFMVLEVIPSHETEGRFIKKILGMNVELLGWIGTDDLDEFEEVLPEEESCP